MTSRDRDPGRAPEPEYRIWKRNGVVGVYIVRVDGEPNERHRVRVRPVFHCWYPPEPGKAVEGRARWVDARRLRTLSAHDVESLALALPTNSQPEPEGRMTPEPRE